MPMRDILFAFGPNGSYFFFCDGEIYFQVTPPTFRQAVKSPNNISRGLRRPYHVTLGPLRYDYSLGFKRYEGPDFLAVDFRRSFPELVNWLQLRGPLIPEDVFITVGPNHSFYARVKDSQKYSSNIPDALKDLLENPPVEVENSLTPAHVSLGSGGSWFLLWPSGEAHWDLAGQYNRLQGILARLQRLRGKTIQRLTLNPWVAGEYFISLEDGNVSCYLPEECARIVKPIIMGPPLVELHPEAAQLPSLFEGCSTSKI
ncbi:hypothetical protein K432DRAFT_410172 [Lepidopterella palustris CBS 459.81]|uniref:Uncharacterized protein n=1 Tax=Lepidopterella palustris CBS 459.81 TaxID=1314670 RepID=A0A8E2J9B3_9PEZI|nr:hypothetical protein K432DRAFT_410172 [Lepidopterella palustris CBS 459.81]